ncbi:hypothetical protein [Sphingobacterium sp. MYb382]|uniref:hypothetical protein n=1 Tax=Sphingobacterium sp. MYb382 TaxID=2745278 RepID=UPI0030980198
MKQILLTIGGLLIVCLTSCIDGQSTYNYTLHSIISNNYKGEVETVIESELRDTAKIEYIKGALRYISSEKKEFILVRQGNSDLYEYSTINEKIKVFAPKGIDTLRVDVSVNKGVNTEATIVFVKNI